MKIFTLMLSLAAIALLATLHTARAGNPPVNALAAAGRIVAGIVTDADGRPAANVDVKLLKTGAGKSGPAKRGPNDSPTGDSIIGAPEANQLQVGKNEMVVKEMKSDSQGKFSFDGIEPGRYSILAGTGKQAARTEVMVKPDSDPAPITVKLMKG